MAKASLDELVGTTAQDVSYGWYPDYAPFSFFISVAFDIPGTPTMTDNVMQSDDMLLYERTLVIGDGDIESIRQSPEGREVVISASPSTHIAVLDDRRLVTTVMLEKMAMLKFGLKMAITSWLNALRTWRRFNLVLLDVKAHALSRCRP